MRLNKEIIDACSVNGQMVYTEVCLGGKELFTFKRKMKN